MILVTRLEPIPSGGKNHAGRMPAPQEGYWSLAYSDLAATRMGTSGLGRVMDPFGHDWETQRELKDFD